MKLDQLRLALDQALGPGGESRAQRAEGFEIALLQGRNRLGIEFRQHRSNRVGLGHGGVLRWSFYSICIGFRAKSVMLGNRPYGAPPERKD
jgi:hypothetical protein